MDNKLDNHSIQEETSADTQRNFIRAMIERDLESGKYHGKVTTRFPPEPNGYLHIGHAKSICLNFGLAQSYNGNCHLRFDDTNPVKEDTEYVDSIQHDVKWLGFDWGDNLFFASDYFEKMYDYALGLIKEGKAYVCSLKEDEIREYRGTVKEPGKHSPFRTRTVEENLDLFERMRAGEFKDGEHVLRAKGDMAAANMKLRDPLLYRIRHAHHHRTGDKWCIYPMYDYAHCLSDSIERITHSICTLEFENNRDLYDWFLSEVSAPTPRPEQTEFARLSLTYTVMSKRKLLQLVQEGLVSGWDDPRMPTIAGMRRRGYTAEALQDFCERIGVAKANSLVDVAQLEYSVRDDLNHRSPRVMCVLDPIKVVIENYPEDKVEMLDAPYWPHDIPKEGTRGVPLTREVFIERDDFMENPPKKFYRLSPGNEVRLRYGYVIRCNEVIKNEAGEVVELRCTYDADTLGKNPEGRKVRGAIHWVSATESIEAEIRLYDRLFSVEQPDAYDGDFKDTMNKDSLVVQKGYVEPSVKLADAGDRFQFERQGYFYRDIESNDSKLVFNRTVALKDSWTRQQDAPATEAPKPKAEKTSKPKTKKQEPVAKTFSPEQEAEIKRLMDAYGIGSGDAETFAANGDLLAFFEDALKHHDNARAIANWVINDVMREVKDGSISALKFGASEVAGLVKLIDDGSISGKIAKTVFAELVKEGGSPAQIVEDKGLKQLTDPAEVQPIVDKILAANEEAVAQYRGGKTNRMGFFVGQVIKETGGRANPQLVNQLLKKSLEG